MFVNCFIVGVSGQETQQRSPNLEDILFSDAVISTGILNDTEGERERKVAENVPRFFQKSESQMVLFIFFQYYSPLDNFYNIWIIFCHHHRLKNQFFLSFLPSLPYEYHNTYRSFFIVLSVSLILFITIFSLRIDLILENIFFLFVLLSS